MASRSHIMSIDPRFSRILVRQRDLQLFLDSRDLVDLPPDDLAAYIRTQTLALQAEAIEVLNETHWKPWATRPEGEPAIPHRDRYLGELADVFIFMMNLMLAGGITMTQLAQAVENKQEKNLLRWTSGYDGKSSKCPGCGRAYDDTGVKCVPTNMKPPFHPETGSPEPPWCDDRKKYIQGEGIPEQDDDLVAPSECPRCKAKYENSPILGKCFPGSDDSYGWCETTGCHVNRQGEILP